MQRTVHQWRELTRQEMERFLKERPSGRLGLCDGGEPYLVPVAYIYSEGKIYFHGAKKGKKVDFIKNNNRVCFEVDEWQQGWISVICYGKVTLRDDLEAKRKFFRLMMGVDLLEDRIKKLNLYIGVIDIEEMTGRCSADFKFG